MIYFVNGYNEKPTYFVEQSVFDENPNYELGTLVVGTKTDAQAFLAQKQVDVLESEAVRFSICVTFVNGNDTTWREVQDSDPEDTICQVFDTYTGTYTECSNKTQAYALNEQKKQEFLASVYLDTVQETNELPKPPVQSAYNTVIYGETVGDIPVEVM